MTVSQDERNYMLVQMQPVIVKVSKQVAANWPGVIEPEDLQQDMWVRLLETPKSVQFLYSQEPKAQTHSLAWIAHQIAKGERLDMEYFTGNFRYSVNEVRRLLAGGMLRGLNPATGSSWAAEDYISQDGSFEDALLNRFSTEIDLVRAMVELEAKNHEQARLIVLKYLVKQEMNEAQRKRLSDALAKLTALMNTSYKKQHAEKGEGPGTRKRVSNARAAVISRNQYAGDTNDVWVQGTDADSGRVRW